MAPQPRRCFSRHVVVGSLLAVGVIACTTLAFTFCRPTALNNKPVGIKEAAAPPKFGHQIEGAMSRLRRLAEVGTKDRVVPRTSPPPPPKSLVADALGAVFGEDGWKLEAQQDGIEIFSRTVKGSKCKQIRGRGQLSVDSESVLRLFQSSDADKIREFNPMYADGHDVEKVNANTKISWSKTHGLAVISPRDFVTFVQLVKTRKGDILILNKSTDHPLCPKGKNNCVRGTMLLGANAVRPTGKKTCEFTFVQQVDTGGSLPTWLMNRLMLRDSVSFIKRIEKAASSGFAPRMRGKLGRSRSSSESEEISIRPALV